MADDLRDRPYTLYRTSPRSLRARLRGEEDAVQDPGAGPRLEHPDRRDRRALALRVAKYLVVAVVAWLLVSLVLFIISAQTRSGGSIPSSAQAELSGGGNMLFSANTVLVLGTDQRPRTGPGSKEPGSNYSDTGSNSDTIMLWRIGGGVSRRLSIPRDTATDIPGVGMAKINAAYSRGGPALALKTVEQFTGLKINHVIIVNLEAFPQFIDAIGGIDVRTGRVCSVISGGAGNGGFQLFLRPGVHHLTGLQALIYARTREDRCNPSVNDLTREAHQQQILNAIKSKLTSPSAFVRLPLASWDAPKVLRTDMGGVTLLSLFAAAELGGSAPPDVLKPTGSTTVPGGGSALTVTPQAVQQAVSKLVGS